MKITYLFLLGCCLTLLLPACTKDKPVEINISKNNLFGTILANKRLSLYQAALKRAGMMDAATFSTGGPFTVFAAQDTAFINAGLTADSINRMDPQRLSLILRYGMVYGRISSSTLMGFYAQDVDCKHPTLQPRLNKNYYGIFFNGIPVIAANSETLTDGVLHELNRMPLPQDQTLLEMIRQRPDLTLFSAIIKRTGNETLLTTMGVNQKGMLLMAPNDNAYRKFGLPDITAIDNADLGMLKSQLESMIWPNKLYTADFIGGYAFRYNFYYAKEDGMTIITAGNILPTHIIHPDLIALNGVLQIVDQVFLVRQ